MADLLAVREEIAHTVVAEELEDVVEVATAPAVGLAGRVASEFLREFVNVNQLLQECAARVEHENLKRLKVGELGEVGSSSSEGVAKKRVDRNSFMWMWSAAYAHLE